VIPAHKILSALAGAMLAASVVLMAAWPHGGLASAACTLTLSLYLRKRGAFREGNTPLTGALLIGGSSIMTLIGVTVLDVRLAFVIVGAAVITVGSFLLVFGARERLRSIVRRLDSLTEENSPTRPAGDDRHLDRLVRVYLRRFPECIAARRVLAFDPGDELVEALLAGNPAIFRRMAYGVGVSRQEFLAELRSATPERGVDLVVTTADFEYAREWLDLETLMRIVAVDGRAILVRPRDVERFRKSTDFVNASAVLEMTEFSATAEECDAEGISPDDRLLIAVRRCA
jgi:hypothetical protein